MSTNQEPSVFKYTVEYKVTMPTDSTRWHALLDRVMGENPFDFEEDIIPWAEELAYRTTSSAQYFEGTADHVNELNNQFEYHLLRCTEEWLVQFMVIGFEAGYYTAYVEEIDSETERTN